MCTSTNTHNITTNIQAGHPNLESNVTRSVLKYITVNEERFLKAYHNRVYAFSSGSIFTDVCIKLEEWTTYVNMGSSEEDDEDGDEDPDDEGDGDVDEEEDEGDEGDGADGKGVQQQTRTPASEMSPENMLRKASTLARLHTSQHVYDMHTYVHICVSTNNAHICIHLHVYTHHNTSTTCTSTCIFARLRTIHICYTLARLHTPQHVYGMHAYVHICTSTNK